MNYLAHLFLSPRDKYILTGNLLGDFRRDLQPQNLPEPVKNGISLHLDIDRYTDNNPVVNRLKQSFSPERRRFAGIIIDVAFDYFLSRHWQEFTCEDRREFIDYSYVCLHDCRHVMPARMRAMLDFMITEDWLGSYAELTGIGWTLDRLGKRMKFKNTLAGSVVEVENNYSGFQKAFLDFFPALQLYIDSVGTD